MHLAHVFSKVVEALEHAVETVVHVMESEEAVKTRDAIHTLADVSKNMVSRVEAKKEVKDIKVKDLVS